MNDLMWAWLIFWIGVIGLTVLFSWMAAKPRRERMTRWSEPMIRGDGYGPGDRRSS